MGGANHHADPRHPRPAGALRLRIRTQWYGELSVMQKQCLADRIPDETTLRARISIWNADRNNRSKKVNWQFRTADARIKLRRLYPVIQME